MNTAELEQAFADGFARFKDEWIAFLRFASISADPAHHADCLECANWLCQHLETIGLDAKLLTTSTKPLVYAEHKGRADRPTVLFYGHYDVQPVDPLDEWKTPPFEPTERDGRLYARGAEDNKGQLLYVVKAIETLINHAHLDVNVKVVIEGEEESGGSGIAEALEKWGDLFKADILMVCDTGMVRTHAPTIVMGLRGVIFLGVTLEGADHDLHSGAHGGTAPNSAEAMIALLNTLHRPDGGIAVEGYEEGVLPPTARERELANTLPFDATLYEKQTGVAPLAGEAAYTPQERVGFRPTIDINGVHSGYGGAGGKTVIPCRALGKLSSRLVPGQDPAACLERIKSHLRKHAPAGTRIAFPEGGVGGPGFRLNVDSDLVAKAREALAPLSDQEPALLWEGASIPVVTELAQVSGAEPLLVGFGHEEDRIHAPNESFSFEQFRLGYLYAARFLSSL